MFPKRSGGRNSFIGRLASRLASPLRRFAGLHRAVIPIVTFCGLLLLTLGGYALFTHDRPRPLDSLVVIVSHDNTEQTVPTTPTTVGELLQKLDITIGEGDVVEPAKNIDIRQDDFRINVYRAKPIEVVDGIRKTFAFSAATTPRSIAKQAGSTVYAEDDLVTQPVTDFLRDGTLGAKVIIKRATPIVMNLYGQPIEIRTQAKTVGDLLKERKIKLGKDDSVQPAQSTILAPQSQVFILRQGTQIASVTEDIPTPVQVILDGNLAMGTSAIRQQGSPGQKVVTYQLNLQNGKEISRSVIQTVIAKNPVQQIEVHGTSLSGIKGNMALAGIASSDYTYADYIISHESGWCPTKAQGQHDCPAVPTNPSTPNGYGLCQATPGSKMVSAGADWATNPITQLKWCSGYATSRYGGWAGAYNYWLAHNNW